MTKSEKIKAEIERMMKYFQQEKDALPITNETRTDRFSLGARISMCEELLEYINEIPDDEPQQLQPISVPFVQGVNNCAAKCCWEPGGVCTNPHRDCIGCPKDWNLGLNTYTSNKIESSGPEKKENPTKDEPQQPQPKIRYPFAGRIVDNCVAKCWEPGGVCINPHRDCIDCPKDWNLGFNTYTPNKIEGNIASMSTDGTVHVDPKIIENATLNGACKLDAAPEVKCGEICDHCIMKAVCDKPEKCKVKVVSIPIDTYTTWTEKDEEMFKSCIGAIQVSDGQLISVSKKDEMVDWLKKKLGKNEE